MQQTGFFVILDYFYPLPPNNPENQNFEKMKKTPGDIILHMCTINENHDVWFLRYRARWTEFFLILDHILHFYPLNNPENQNFQKMKKMPGDIIILHKCTKSYDQVMDVWFLRYDARWTEGWMDGWMDRQKK